MNNKDIQLSKSLSWLLRHSAVQEGLKLSPEGYLDVDKVLQHKSFRGYNKCDIERVVLNNEKQRFQLRTDPITRALQIKANQGHSIAVSDAELTPILKAGYCTVVHGTYTHSWPKIKQSGLSRMRRRHIHLAKGVDNSVISGLRRNAQIHIFINLDRALNDGIKFYESDNGVVLTPGNEKGFLGTEYFDKVVEVSTGECNHLPVKQKMEAGPVSPLAKVPARAAASRPAFVRSPPAHAPQHPPRTSPRAQDQWQRRRAERPEPHDKDYERMVLVTGFPSYSQPQDLAHVFCTFGNVRVDRIVENRASLVYTSAAEAKAAIKASTTLNIYGEFLTVRPYTRATDFLMQPKKKDNVRNKPKVPTVNPSSISWAGDFHAQLHALLSAVRLSDADIQRLAALYRDLELALQPAWPGCRAIPFGSVTTGLGVKSSDADCFMLVPGGGQRVGQHAVPRARRVLAQHPRVFGELLAIPRANTPIVKFVHLPTATHCDLSFKTPLGARNSELVRFLLHADPRLLPVAVAAKYWAGVHELTGTGKLTNYALTMLVVFYLQQAPASLPAVEALQRERARDLPVDFWNTGFSDRTLPPSDDTRNIAEMLGGFFTFYAQFDFETFVVCPFLGRAIPKGLFADLNLLPDEFERYKLNVSAGVALPLRHTTALCVQDPLEQCHNVASPVSSRLAADIQAYFRFAADAFIKSKPGNYRNFLKTILLEKPKLQRKSSAEYRIRLAPSVLHRLAVPDWRAVVRDIVFLVFQTILKLDLVKIDPDAKENENPETKVQQNSNVKGKGKAIVRNNNLEKKKIEVEENPDVKGKAVVEAKENGIPDKKENANAKMNEQLARRDKEHYAGSIAKAIWKRKQFSKLYSAMGLRFIERETMITEEILRTDKNVMSIDFQLVISFSNGHRGCVMTLKPGDSDLNFYREFAKFLTSVMQYWFATLAKPYCEPKNNDGTKKSPKNEATKGKPNTDAATNDQDVTKEVDTDTVENEEPDSSDSNDSDISYEDERVAPNAEESANQDNDTNEVTTDSQVTQTS